MLFGYENKGKGYSKKKNSQTAQLSQKQSKPLFLKE